MKNCIINNFTPFPGNYFSYIFNNEFDLKKDEHISWQFSKEPEIAVEVKVIQTVKLGFDLKVQFKVIRALKKNNQSFRTFKIDYGENKVNEVIKNNIKQLLVKWDKDEFSESTNHYFQEIDKDISLQRFIELAGGCINRPNKFPFNSDKLKEQSIKERLSLLSLEQGDEQVLKIIDILNNEINS